MGASGTAGRRRWSLRGGGGSLQVQRSGEPQGAGGSLGIGGSLGGTWEGSPRDGGAGRNLGGTGEPGVQGTGEFSPFSLEGLCSPGHVST